MHEVRELRDFIERQRPLVVLTGAGISADSGIPTYRDDNGEWCRSRPIQHREFVEQAAARRRYWARSMAGWRYVQQATPNAAHRALVALEHRGDLALLATQNVDRLHQRAGHCNVVDLHGRIDRVCCLACQKKFSRAQLQRRLEALNPGWYAQIVEVKPDGDAEVADEVVEQMRVPACDHCGGTLMPDVVFFGGTVPAARVQRVASALDRARGLLVVGTSLSVYSGFRFCRLAQQRALPMAIVNRGPTRADAMAALRVQAGATQILSALAGPDAAATHSSAARG